jgi:hypothetical protein
MQANKMIDVFSRKFGGTGYVSIEINCPAPPFLLASTTDRSVLEPRHVQVLSKKKAQFASSKFMSLSLRRSDQAIPDQFMKEIFESAVF